MREHEVVVRGGVADVDVEPERQALRGGRGERELLDLERGGLRERRFADQVEVAERHRPSTAAPDASVTSPARSDRW